MVDSDKHAPWHLVEDVKQRGGEFCSDTWGEEPDTIFNLWVFFCIGFVFFSALLGIYVGIYEDSINHIDRVNSELCVITKEHEQWRLALARDSKSRQKYFEVVSRG